MEKKAESLGIDHGIIETNRIIYGNPTEKEITGFHTFVTDAANIVGGLIFPPIGLLSGLMSFIPALHNNNLARNLQKKLNNVK